MFVTAAPGKIFSVCRSGSANTREDSSVNESTPPPVNRRGLLRRASTVAAVAGAAGVVTTLNAAPAAAAVGDALTAGTVVDAVNTTTGVKTNGASAFGFTAENASGAQLRLIPRGAYLNAGQAPVGSFNVTVDGDLEFQVAAGGYAADVQTTWNSTSTYPVGPVRLLDTRAIEPGFNRELILNPGCLNSQGKLIAGQTLYLDLSIAVSYGWAAFGNVTMQAPEKAGFCTVYAGGAERPTASTVNFLAGWPISNGALVPLGETLGSTDVIAIYSSTNTHVLFDLTGLVVSSPYAIFGGETVGAEGIAPSSAAESRSTRKPTRGDAIRAAKPRR
jgi:hypothetical protein